MNCLIVDDDKMARTALERLVTKIDSLHLVASSENVEEALKILDKEEIDLIFLDIEMPGSSGFELLDKCPVLPQVIVTSAKEEYAFEAFQYEVSNYLKKPISFSRFRQAVDKLLLDKKDSQIKGLRENIFIKSSGRYIKIKIDDIIYIENVGDYVKFQLEEKSHISHSTLKGLAAKLPQEKFMKVHRSYIVNLNKIVDLEENSLLVGRKIIPVSRANKAGLLARLNLI